MKRPPPATRPVPRILVATTRRSALRVRRSNTSKPDRRRSARSDRNRGRHRTARPLATCATGSARGSLGPRCSRRRTPQGRAPRVGGIEDECSGVRRSRGARAPGPRRSSPPRPRARVAPPQRHQPVAEPEPRGLDGRPDGDPGRRAIAATSASVSRAGSARRSARPFGPVAVVVLDHLAGELHPPQEEPPGSRPSNSARCAKESSCTRCGWSSFIA